MFQSYRVTEYWQRACVYYVRLDEFVREFSGGVSHELDSSDGPDTPYILVMNELGKPVGTCRLRYLDEHTGKIERVSVLKEYRKFGAGTIAIHAAEDWLRENGVTKIVINSRKSAIGFYEKLGYITDWTSHQKSAGAPFETVNTYKTLSPHKAKG